MLLSLPSPPLCTVQEVQTLSPANLFLKGRGFSTHANFKLLDLRVGHVLDRGPITFSFHALVALLETFFLLPLESNGENHSPQLVLSIPLSCLVL